MARVIESLAVALPGIHAVRTSIDEPYVGVKDAFSLCRIERGRSRFWMRGRVWAGAPGTVIVQQPGDFHRDVAREGAITYQILHLPAAAVDGVIGNVRVSSVVAGDDGRGVALRRLHDAIAVGADRFALECTLAEAVGALTAMADGGAVHSRPVRRALALIRDRIADPVTLDELAAHAGLDKFHLCRAFRAQIGMPPHAYLTQLRIGHAKELLAAGAKPKDVAAQVGLYDQSQLNRHFRRIVGMTPGAFAQASLSAKNPQAARLAVR